MFILQGLYNQGKSVGSVSFSGDRESQGIHNVVKENYSIMITLVREKRIITQKRVSIDQGNTT